MPILVNDVEITLEQVHEEMQYHPAPSVEKARHSAAQALIIRQLLLQEVKQQQLLNHQSSVSTEDEEAAIEKLIRREVSVPEADRKSCKLYYEKNRERFTDPLTNQPLSFEQAFSYIRDYLHTRSLRMGVSQYIKLLASRARISGFDLEASDSPLVQ